MDMLTGKKICRKCITIQEWKEFHKNARYDDGRAQICKRCKGKYDKQHYPKVREKRINQVEIWQIVNKIKPAKNNVG